MLFVYLRHYVLHNSLLSNNIDVTQIQPLQICWSNKRTQETGPLVGGEWQWKAPC